jgi:hypothetical protein
VLPLALVALRGNFIIWVDAFMVRRETGAERPVGMDFGFGARALREAHLLQFQHHLADALNDNKDQFFAATAYFDALPPVGQFPSETLDPDQLTQRFFPAGIEVELSIVPDDELPALIEESLLLPPIDLTDSLEERDGTGVIVLVPVPRTQFNELRTSLPKFDEQLPELRPAFLQITGLATPKDLLLAQRFRPLPPPVKEDEPWRKLLRDAVKNRLLWYVRRRHLPIPSNVAGTPVNASGNPKKLVTLIRENSTLTEQFGRIKALGSPEVDMLTKLLAEDRFVEHPALVKSLLVNASGKTGSPLRADELVAKLAPAADSTLGDGLDALEKEDAVLGRTLSSDRVAETGVLAEVDKIARRVPPDKFSQFARELKVAAKDEKTLTAKVAELDRKFSTP